MNGTDQIAAHLRGRPFAEIFEQSHEKDNVIALKLMCILDFQMEQLNLYTKIQATKPKLLGLLLQFSSFASFKYYDYAVKKEIGARVVRCKFCDLVGPYANILTHMAVNHNTHVGMKMCLYCNRVELENHFTEKSLDPCYQKYLRQNETNDGKFNPKVLEIVTGFFAMLKKLSKTLDIHSVRQKQYTGLGYRAVEKLNQNYGDDFPNECTVFKQPARKVKDISTSLGLDMEFHRALSYFYGSCDSTRSPAQHQQTSNHAVVVDAQPQNIPADNGHQFHFGVSPKNESMEISSMPMQIDTAARASFHRRSSRTTAAQHQDDVPMNDFQAASNVSSSNIAIDIQPIMDGQANGGSLVMGGQSYESVFPGANIGAVFNHLPYECVQFGLFVAQREARLRDELSRRKLEHAIQATILNIEGESFE